MARIFAAGTVGCLVLVPTQVQADDNRDCDDFANSRQAQDYYEAHPLTAADLDRDRDGLACDWGPPAETRHDSWIPVPDDSTLAGLSGISFDLPWYGWAGGILIALWVVGLIRVARA